MSPPPLTLSHTPFVPGAVAQVVAAGAAPGQLVNFAVSVAGPGAGPCPGALRGTCLGLQAPVRPLGSVTAGADGRAVLALWVPANVPGPAVGIQAVLTSPDVVLSPAITVPTRGQCAAGYETDCRGLCFPSSAVGNGTCDDGTPRALGAPDFDCPAFADDGGDCVTGPAPLEVCYPGPAEDFSVCLPVVDYDPTRMGPDYDYPAGSGQYQPPVRFVDLDLTSPTLALAPNFVMDEVMQAWKGRYGVMQPHTIERLQEIREDLGGPLNINSGYRSPDYNAGVGGVQFSRHQFGDGIDMWASNSSLADVGATCDNRGASYVGYYTSHVHCDWRNDALEPVFFDLGASSGQLPPPPLLALDTRPALSATLVPGRVWRAPARGWDEGEPLREWVAWDASGAAIAEVVAETFEPPEAAARVGVWVGREVWLEVDR